MAKAVFEYMTGMLNTGVVRIKSGHCAAGTTNAPNWHEHIEILFCKSGSGTVQLDDRKYNFSKGDFIIVNSQVIHSITGISELYFDFAHIDRNFCVANDIDTSVIKFCEHINEDILLNKVFTTLKEVLSDTGEFTRAKINKAVLELLIYICENYISENNRAHTTDAVFERVKKVMLYLKQNFEKELTLEKIAAEAGINKYQLTREFKASTGDSVFEFINALRCKEARSMLKKGVGVTETAFSCGFSNLSYFSRTYKKYMGELPSSTKQGKM